MGASRRLITECLALLFFKMSKVAMSRDGEGPCLPLNSHTQGLLIIPGCHNLYPISCWDTYRAKRGLEEWWIFKPRTGAKSRLFLSLAKTRPLFPSLWKNQEHYPFPLASSSATPVTEVINLIT